MRRKNAEKIAISKDSTANQVALSYLLHLDFPVFPLIGPGSTAQLKDSLKLLNINLLHSDIKFLLRSSVSDMAFDVAARIIKKTKTIIFRHVK